MTTDIEDLDERFIKDLLKFPDTTSYDDAFIELKRKHKHIPSKRKLSMAYQRLLKNELIKPNQSIEDKIRHKSVRSRSGVVVITLVMKPDKFSCQYNCYMCPDERIENGATVDMPRSYLSTEPAEMRAMEVNFDTIGQFNSRLNTLVENGHEPDKIEIIVLGGTFSTYPRDYQEEFIRDVFYAANTYFDKDKREPLPLEQEQHHNENAQCHIVGLSLETRPDQINRNEIKRLRKYGCTRVQMGVQHTDNNLLKVINRGHTVETSIKAIRMLKEVGFKVEIHIMPDLPDATPKGDMEMMDKIFLSQDFQPDYIKIYPCLDVIYTEIRKWKQTGKWKPYAEEENGEKLFKVLLHGLRLMPYWVRDSRVQRDFPEAADKNNQVGYESKNIRTNLYQLLLNKLAENGEKCKSIRCREVKNKTTDISMAKMFIEKYRASDGLEYFISYESPERDVLYGFVRLRFNQDSSKSVFEELKGAALIREVHVYGTVKAVNTSHTDNRTQHYGFGKKLVKKAEDIAYRRGYDKMAIISAVGTRNYYRKLGYQLEGTYMTKKLTKNYLVDIILYFVVIFLLMWIVAIIKND
jgi:ELP3 family radical SAM enzyme/protein acetyltransferase